MNRPIFSLLLLLFLGAACPADEATLRGAMAGEYELIGRKPDSTITYSGRVVLQDDGRVLWVTRTVGHKTTKGALRFDTVAGSDRIPVMRMRFILDGIEYQATYRWQSDPDNYFRFTGVYGRADNKTKSPGLEALFPLHN
jgi:hypothetical protein